MNEIAEALEALQQAMAKHHVTLTGLSVAPDHIERLAWLCEAKFKLKSDAPLYATLLGIPVDERA